MKIVHAQTVCLAAVRIGLDRQQLIATNWKMARVFDLLMAVDGEDDGEGPDTGLVGGG